MHLVVSKMYVPLHQNKICNYYKVEISMKTVEYLLSFNIKPSVQRIAVMDYLLTHKTHPNIDEIYSALNKTMPTLSKTTIYNTLRLFVEHGAALMLTIDDKYACFDGDIHPHAHFLCSKCNKIYDLPLSEDFLERSMQGVDEYKVDEVALYYRGTCPNCLKKEKLNKN